MPFFYVPTLPNVLGEVDERIYANGIRRRDAKVIQASSMTGAAPGSAMIQFPAYSWEVDVLQDGDFVEIFVYSGGFREIPIFRGFVSGPRKTLTNGIGYLCIDERGHLDDGVFTHDYNVPDAITGARATPVYFWDLLSEVEDEYRAHQMNNGNTHALTFSKTTFPNAYIGEQHLKGVHHGQGIQQILDEVGLGHWRMYVEHNTAGSVLKAFKLGSGLVQQTIRGQNPTLRPSRQPAGVANVGGMIMEDDRYRVVNHVKAEGRRRLVETAVDLEVGWDPTNEDTIINNWNLYTVPNLNEFQENPYYSAHARRVGCHYNIPKIDDRWTDLDGIPRGRIRHPRILNHLIQTFYILDGQGDARPLEPFVLYKFATDSEWRFMDSGFRISNDRELIFDKPLVQHIPFHWFDNGTGEGFQVWHGHNCMKVENGENNRAYASGLGDYFNDFDLQTHDYYLFFTAQKVAFKIEDVLSKIPGEESKGYILELPSGTDLTGLNGEDDDDVPNDFLIFRDFNPQVDSGTKGFGDDQGKYDVSLDIGSNYMTVNEHVGKSLVLGESFVKGDAEQYKVYKVYSNTSTALYVQELGEEIKGEVTDLSEVSGNWSIIENRVGEAFLPTDVKVNLAYESERRLAYDSGKQSSGDINPHRIVHFTRDEFRWWTKTNNFEVSYDNESGAHSVAESLGAVEVLKEDTELQTWALLQIEATKEPFIEYSVRLPKFDLFYEISSRLRDNWTLTDASIVGIVYNFLAKETHLIVATV